MFVYNKKFRFDRIESYGDLRKIFQMFRTIPKDVNRFLCVHNKNIKDCNYAYFYRNGSDIIDIFSNITYDRSVLVDEKFKVDEYKLNRCKNRIRKLYDSFKHLLYLTHYESFDHLSFNRHNPLFLVERINNKYSLVSADEKDFINSIICNKISILPDFNFDDFEKGCCPFCGSKNKRFFNYVEHLSCLKRPDYFYKRPSEESDIAVCSNCFFKIKGNPYYYYYVY